jgi:prepilin-type N-terminal cleavage/methylation domain-containing protein
MTRMPGRGRGGFTLLEVMIATSILAVGTVSVMAVFASAVGFANRRQANAEMSEVLQEARSEAHVLVDTFKQPKTGSPAATTRDKTKSAPATMPGGPGGKVAEKQSTIHAGYRYELQFTPVLRDVPEAGYRTAIIVRYGDGQEYVETLAVLPSSIPDEEFSYSSSFEEESAGRADRKGGRETK